MIAFAVVMATIAGTAPTGPDAPTALASKRTLLLAAAPTQAAPSAATSIAATRATLADAPTSGGAAFLASSLTSFTGLVTLIGMASAPPPGQPGSDFAWRARLAASLFLMSAGPSVGDLLNDDKPLFFVATGLRTLICAVSWAGIELSAAAGTATNSSTPFLVVGTILVVTVGALVWSGWCAVDLVRSFFAPDRWVRRHNERLPLPTRAPSPAPSGGTVFMR